MKKKIFFYIKRLNVGGAERVLIRILQGIDREKFQVELILRTKILEENKLISELPKGIIIKSLISDKTALKKNNILKMKDSILKKILLRYNKNQIKKEEKKAIFNLINEKYDIGINHDIDFNFVPKLKPQFAITWVHNSIKERFKNTPERVIEKAKELKFYDKIITICDDMTREMNEMFPKESYKMKRIYNMIDLKKIEKLSCDLSNVTSNQKLLLNNEEYIVAIKRLDTESKDFKTLIEGFKLFKEKNKTGLKLVILGDGPNREEVEKIINKNRLKEEVILLGNTNNPFPFIKKSLFFIHSSLREGLPNVLIEAQALEKAVISSNTPTGPREILQDGDLGVLFPIGDVKKLSKEIEKLYFDEELRNKYAKKGKNMVKRFEKEVIIKEIENLIS